MFRLTVSGPIVDQVREMIPGKQKTWIRTYRWANKWGEYCIEHDEWSCDIRQLVSSKEDNGNRVVLEKTESVDCNEPPYDVDDIWEEEVIKISNGTCGNLLVLKGTNSELRAMCKTYSPALLEWLSKLLPVVDSIPVSVPVNVLTKKPAVIQKQGNYSRRPVCLIENY